MILFFKFVPIGILISCLILPLSIAAYSPITIQFNTQPLTGFSTYTIGGLTESKLGQFAYHFPVSKLRFPTNVDVANINVLSYLTPQFLAHLQIQKNISHDAGKLQDSDWLSPDSTIQDIYSESDTTLYFSSFDLTLSTALYSIIYPNLAKTTYRFLVGYKYQYFKFQAYDLIQWYPSDSSKTLLTQAGTVITYNLTQKMPYWGFDINQTLAKLSIDIRLGFSPYVLLADTDDHVLRSKIAKGSLSGTMHFATLLLNYQLTKSLTSFLRFYSQTIQSHGTQVQSRYQDTQEGNVGHIADIDETIESHLSTLSFGITYRLNSINFTSPSSSNFTPLSLIRVGSSLYIPFKERYSCMGPQLEFKKNSFILGISYYQGNNKINSLSKGVYTTIPVYLLYKLPLIPYLYLGGGYSYHINDMHPHAISYLTRLGFPNPNETVQSSWFGLLSFEKNIPYSNNHVRSFVRYFYQNTTLQSHSDHHHFAKKLSLTALQVGVSIQI